MAQQIFNLIASGLKADPSVVQKIGGIFQFNVAGKSWIVNLKTGNGEVREGSGNADCTLTFTTEQDFIDVMTGKLSGTQAFGVGKLRIAGNMALAMKLEQLKKAMTTPSSASASSSSPSSTSSVATVFAQLAKNISADPSIVNRVNGIYKFVLDGKPWIVDLKNAPGNVKEGDGSADCTITMTSDDFVNLMAGKIDGQTAFMQGKLKVQGNVGLALKLNQLRGDRKSVV